MKFDTQPGLHDPVDAEVGNLQFEHGSVEISEMAELQPLTYTPI